MPLPLTFDPADLPGTKVDAEPLDGDAAENCTAAEFNAVVEGVDALCDAANSEPAYALARCTANAVVATGILTRVDFATVVTSDGITVTTGAAWSAEVARAGKYLVNWALPFSATAGDCNVTVTLGTDGGDFKQRTKMLSGDLLGMNGSVVVELAAGETIHLKFTPLVNGVTMNAGSESDAAFISISEVR